MFGYLSPVVFDAGDGQNTVPSVYTVLNISAGRFAYCGHSFFDNRLLQANLSIIPGAHFQKLKTITI